MQIEGKGFDLYEKMAVPMEPERELEVAERAGKLAAGAGFDPEAVDEIKLAIIEAVINSIEHGRSPQRKVFITFGVNRNPERMKIAVSDSGGGFNPGVVEKPDIRKKMHSDERKRGWGLEIMRSMMDEVYIESSREGTTITLVKNARKVI
ncbi:MAG: ATP-binding protein [Gemmatimonadota bacterium]|nr:ATP-binding protein [Gemmatimonadota bacterium]